MNVKMTEVTPSNWQTKEDWQSRIFVPSQYILPKKKRNPNKQD